MEPNPVTEAEMRDFFQRVTTAFVSLSKQSAELSELRSRFDMMSQELDGLRTTNSRLIQERDSAISKELEHEQALTDARKGNDYLAERVHALNALITSRDAAVSDLQGQVASTKQAHEAEQKAHEATKQELEQRSTDYVSVREARDRYQDQAEAAERELKAVQDKLTAIESQLGTILGLAKPAPVQEAVQEVAEAVKEAAPTPDPSPSTAGTSGNEQPSGPVTSIYEPSVEHTEVKPEAPADNRPWWEKHAAS